MNKKSILASVLALTLLSCVGIALAYWVYSSVIQVDVGVPTVSLTATSDGLYVAFSGTLKDSSGVGISSESVVIYETDSDGNILSTIATVTTLASGTFTYDWEAPSAGTYYFKAGYEDI